MFITGSRPRMQEHKGQDNLDRGNYWHSEPESRGQRDRRRPAETPATPSPEEMEMECERWDGLS